MATPAADPLPGPLSGLLVADLSRVLAGPYATMLLADLGAEVVKVERRDDGDDTRSWGPPWSDGVSTYFQSVNRGKRTLPADLDDPADLARVRDLAARADVLVENFRPGALDRFGLDHATLAAANPGLVYCSITGFGAGAGAPLAGYDLLAQAVGGLMSVTGPDAAHPTKVGVALVDVVTGLHAVVGIQAALRHREATGRGQRVEVDLLSSLLSALVNQVSAHLNAGVVPVPLGNRHPSIAPYEALAAADRPLVVAVGNDRQFAALCDVLGLPGLPGEDRFATNPARVRHRDELSRLLSAVLATRPAQDWTAALTAAGVPCGPVNSVAEAVDLAEALGLDPVVELAGDDASVPTRQIRPPFRLSETPARATTGPPRLPPDDRPARAQSK